MRHILTLNAGSSSIKFALYGLEGEEPEEQAHGQIEGLGTRPRFTARTPAGEVVAERELAGGADHDAALAGLLRWLEERFAGVVVEAVGHRVVHGGPVYSKPIRLDDDALATLAGFNALAPLHQPHNLAGIHAARAAFPEATQVACFDTAFHRGHPWVNDVYALPRRYYDEGVRRYGFHGLSYAYIVHRLREIAPELVQGRLVVAHLGNGASLCAIKAGRPIASTLGFSALDGLPMGTRCGDLDPGVVLYLLQSKGMDAAAIETLLYKESGLKGLSGISNDMRALEASDAPAAKAAIDYFVYRLKRELGAMAAAIGGLDGLVFTGGIGENSELVRRRVCADLGFLGLAVDDAKNAAHAADIAAAGATCRIMVVPTNEEAMIARETVALLA
ncbi:MAG: acetate/propionate family kinase [Alphaproteobacteria bacterium]